MKMSGFATTALHIPTPSPQLAARDLGDVPQAVDLIRPDQHVVARWPEFDAAAIETALLTAIGKAS